MKKTLHLLLVLLFLTISTGGFAEEQTYTLDYQLNKSEGGSGFWNTDKTVTTQTVAINGIEWTIVSDTYYMGYSKTNGQQIGSASYPLHHATLSTDGIQGVIKSVAVTARCKNGSTSTVSVSVGNTSYNNGSATSATLTSTNTESVFTAENAKSGKIDIIFDQEDNSSAAAINFIKAVIVYDPDATSETEYEEAKIYKKRK